MGGRVCGRMLVCGRVVPCGQVGRAVRHGVWVQGWRKGGREAGAVDGWQAWAVHAHLAALAAPAARPYSRVLSGLLLCNPNGLWRRPWPRPCPPTRACHPAAPAGPHASCLMLLAHAPVPPGFPRARTQSTLSLPRSRARTHTCAHAIRPLPSSARAGEGAHATFAPRGWKQAALAHYVTNLYGHCEIEQVRLGGLGLGLWLCPLCHCACTCAYGGFASAARCGVCRGAGREGGTCSPYRISTCLPCPACAWRCVCRAHARLAPPIVPHPAAAGRLRQRAGAHLPVPDERRAGQQARLPHWDALRHGERRPRRGAGGLLLACGGPRPAGRQPCPALTHYYRCPPCRLCSVRTEPRWAAAAACCNSVNSVRMQPPPHPSPPCSSFPVGC